MFTPAQLTPSTSTTQHIPPASDGSNNPTALSDGIKFEKLKSLPKYNSHCHLGGEFPLETLLKYANLDQIEALNLAMSAIASGAGYQKAFEIFPIISAIINTHEKLREATYATCQQFKSDNNQIVLMRTGLKQLEGKDYEEYLKTVLKGIQEAVSDNFAVFLMLSLKRSSTLEMAKLTIDLALQYRDQGIVGIDISDISTTGDIKTILPELRRAKENGLKIAVHMGESMQEQDQMLILEELEPDLIDHGVNLCVEAKEWIKARNIPVTACITSSIATNMHDSAHLHPWIREFLESKCEYPTDLGTDDSTIFGRISLTSELFRLCSDLEFEKIVQLAKKSFERSKYFFGVA